MIRIKLTEEQIKELDPLEERARETNSYNHKPAITAQVFPGEGFMMVDYMNAWQARMLKSLFNPTKEVKAWLIELFGGKD